MILIVSFDANQHVEEVRRHLTAPHAVVDVSWFPSRMQLAAEIDGGSTRMQLRCASGELLDLAEVGAVWYRRIRPYELHDDLQDPTGRLFAWSECNEAVLGVWYTMPCFWMNPPLGDEVAQRKVHQLRLAQLVGLTVPDTLVTNDPDRARDFVDRHGQGNVIRKAFRNIAEAPRETALVGSTEVSMLETVRYAPVIFQRYVPAAADLRVTIVDGDVFAARIRSDSEHVVDYRTGLGTATVDACTLPDDVADRLRLLMDHLNVVFGAIDLRETPDGDHVFLEINPAGEFMFIAGRTGLPIGQALASSLERHDAARAQ